MKLTIRVYPAAKHASVGGRYGSSDPPVLIVRVTAPAVDGKANEAVLASVSAALQIPRRQARIVSGTRNRTKVLELEGADPQLLLALIGTPAE